METLLKMEDTLRLQLANTVALDQLFDQASNAVDSHQNQHEVFLLHLADRSDHERHVHSFGEAA